MSPNVIKAQKISKSGPLPNTVEDRLARFCYYFHQYTFQDARRMPAKRIQQMLRIADREYGRKMHDMLIVMRASAAKNPDTVLRYFKEMSEK